MGKVFAVTSGKGGVGKSTVSVGIAQAFCNNDNRVLLVDMDEGLRCLDLMVGVDGDTVFDLSDILMGKDIEDAVYKAPKIENLYLIPAPTDIGKIDIFALTSFVTQVKEKYDVVIFDFPAGIDFTLYPALPKDTLFLTVATPDVVSVRDACVVSTRLKRLSFSSKLLINQFEVKDIKKGNKKNIDDVIDGACLQLVGIVPCSYELGLLSVNHKLNQRCRAFGAFSRIVKRLYGESVNLPKPKKI